MVQRLKEATGREIDALPWSADTKRRALEKLHAMVAKIGFPDHPRDYSRVRVVREDWLADAMSASRIEMQRQLAESGKPTDRTEWNETAPTVNAYYDPHTNAINLDAGYLQPPLYAESLDDAARLGGLGTAIGHEIMHAFDDEGRQYDAVGNLRDWWTAGDAQAFEARARCTVAQYNSYQVVGSLHVNGKLTLGENLADAAGVRVAYRALLEHFRRQDLPSKDRSSAERRFFVAYAQRWCRKSTDQALRLGAETSAHAPSRARVVGVVSTMPEFQRAFQCRPGQPMVATSQCRSW